MAYDTSNIRINADLATLKSEAERLKSDPTRVQEFHDDPEAFLGRFGIELDKETLRGVQSRLAARQGAAASGAAQAGTVHVDFAA